MADYKEDHKESIQIHYHRYELISDLLESDRELLLRAKAALHHAYAPYSKFKVGAAARLDDDTVMMGSNQENVSFGLCICAEQNVLSTVGSSTKNCKIHSIAISAKSDLSKVEHPVSPCGACRQVIQEFEHRQGQPIRIILQGESGPILIFENITDLLPFSFSADQLPRS